MADAYDRAYDPSRVPKIESRLSDASLYQGVDIDATSYREGQTYLHGFKGPATNGVRTRPKEPPAGSSTWRWEHSPADYNEVSTALTNRAKSGDIVKDAEKRAEHKRKFPSDFAKKNKPETVKINTDPAKGK